MRENNMVVHNLPKMVIGNVYSHIYFDIPGYSSMWIFKCFIQIYILTCLIYILTYVIIVVCGHR